ncbi:MAG: immunoglobulin domain-containing protein [Verrucomicrobiae bacterium]|nr:immunoglobulin domain-containing protein [Verrucomicrobiae bacterium]
MKPTFRCFLLSSPLAAWLNALVCCSVGTNLFAQGSSDCTPLPVGAVSWWPGGGATSDLIGGNSGVLTGNAGYGTGKVAQGFVFDGSSDAVLVGNPTNLRLQNFTIEAWIKRASTAFVSSGPGVDGLIFGYGGGGYGFGLDRESGRPMLTRVGFNGVTAETSIADTSFHHVAVTKSGATVVFYVDGVAYPAPGYSTTYTFDTIATIGARGDNLNNCFYGSVDELAIYNRALLASEIQAIYDAGSEGKCLGPASPVILSQPEGKLVGVGGSVTFAVVASGTPPLSYQWRFNGVNLPAATDSSLELTNVQFDDAGDYSVVVSNAFGTTISSNAALMVTLVFPCAPAAAGLVSWWRGEGIAHDAIGGNDGILAGQASYGPGKVGQGFVFGGNTEGVLLGNPASLRLQNFTIEAWIRRASTAYVSSRPGVDGLFFGFGGGGYGFGLDRESGRPFLSRIGVSAVIANTSISDTNFHHLAVTKSGGDVVFYVDGVAHAVPEYAPVFTFATSAVIGASGANFDAAFNGSVDELAIYSRALSASEIQAIHNAGDLGKCDVPPIITSQPADQIAIVGDDAVFHVEVTGTLPLVYQWRLDGAIISGATDPSLVVANVQFAQAGAYSVVISNSGGNLTSSEATLTVHPIPPCVPPPSGLVSWWPGDGNTADVVGSQDGVLTGHTDYGAGRVGQGFVFDGNGDAVLVGNHASLRFQDFTIEAWIRRASTVYVSSGPGVDGLFFGYGAGGYGFGLDREGGRPMLTRIAESVVRAEAAITDTSFHHMAVTKSGGTVVFYVDGVAYAVPAYSPTFTFTTPAAIGARGDNLSGSFLGTVDELTIYNRALSASEIQAIYNTPVSGKCDAPPSIVFHPMDQVTTVDGEVTFNVTASGTLPLSYQWRRNGTDLEGATGSSLTLINVQLANAGSYSVAVSNIAGTATSSNATLTVNLPPSAMLVEGLSVGSASPLTVPVRLVANGEENALGFSINFDPTLLNYTSMKLGEDAPDALLLANTNQLGNGRIGVVLALSSSATFAAGNHELVRLEFTTALVTEATEATITFGDVPIRRQMSDTLGNPLPATYTGGFLSIAAVVYEGDVAPRPDGDRNVTITDWVLAGRYAARLDYPTNVMEFQRADCAPRATLGDGQITVIDWVQVGRYLVAFDPLTPVGGPSEEMAEGQTAGATVRQAGDDGVPGRQLRMAEGLLLRDQSVTLDVSMQALGNENALGFSVSFDPAVLSFAGATPVPEPVGATLHVNSQQAGAGRLGLVLALTSGNTFSAGTKEVAKLTFNAATPASTNCMVALVDQPVPRQISDANAMPLAATYQNASIIVNPLPELRIMQVEQDIVLSWPLWASNFTLHEASSLVLPPEWTPVEGEPGTGAGEHKLTQPLNGSGKFYRLIAQ